MRPFWTGTDLPKEQYSTSYCMDTGLKHVAWTDGDKIEFVKL